MKIIIHDLGDDYAAFLANKADVVIFTDGKYAPCQGCFHCWTKHPAKCDLKDSLQEISRVVGQADELVIITQNWYGGYSPAVKNLLDRCIGQLTPLSTYRKKQMHHTLRYGKHDTFCVVCYGDISEQEEKTLRLMVERNAINDGYQKHKLVCLGQKEELEDYIL